VFGRKNMEWSYFIESGAAWSPPKHALKHMVKLKNITLSPAYEVTHGVVFKTQLYR
jgi:hypothetical protein